MMSPIRHTIVSTRTNYVTKALAERAIFNTSTAPKGGAPPKSKGYIGLGPVAEYAEICNRL